MTTLLQHAIAVWSATYTNSAALRTLIGFAHIGGLVGGGGAAIAADRATLAAAGQPPAERVRQLRLIHQTHRVVVAGLAVVIVSGLLLFAADTSAYVTSRLFWSKMALLGLLLINGTLLARAGSLADAGDDRAWRTLKRTAIVSLGLWLLTTLAGTALPNAG